MRTNIVTCLIALSLAVTIGAAAVKEEDKLANLCEDGCFCDDIKPYLIDCKENRLVDLYDADEWKITLEAKNITDVDLDVRFNDNKLKAIPAFPPLNIVNLDFRNNRINQIADHAFAELKYLVSLDLSYNNFTAQDLPEYVFVGKLNTTFYFPLPLQHLNLSHNHIHSIEKDLFDHLPALTSLDLSYNPIRVLGGSTSVAIATLRKLTYLNLGHCQLKSIPEGMIHDLQFLESIDLTGNEFTEVPSEIRNSHNLSVLILDDNNIEFLNYESFRGLTNLRSLSISHNSNLKIIEEQTFSPLKSLVSLSLHHNRKLDKISNAAFYEIYEKEGVSGEWPVKEIQLNDNALTHIDQALAEWENVHFIDIQNNPFRCDCNAQWLIQTLVHQIAQTHPQNARDLVCSSPAPLVGDNLLDLSILPQIFSKCGTDSDEFMGDVSQTNVPSYQAAGVTILTIGVILIVIGLAILSVIVVKRRAIAQALVHHQEIRYKRADMDDTDSYRSPSQVFRVA